MPAAEPREIVDALLEAIEESGYSGILLSAVRTHPRKFLLHAPDGTTTTVWAYVWTLTFGGRPSLPDEFRIQMTSVTSPLELNPLGPTVLMGYEQNLRVFAGFDLHRHRTFTEGSPSVQIDVRRLRHALQDGLAFDRKGNEEIAVAFRPDQFVNYVTNAADFHKYGKQLATFDLLAKAASLKKLQLPELSSLSAERQRVVQTLSRLSREASFRLQVLDAYGHRCCVTRMQLRLVDAAHILPVGAPESVDDVRNGLALSPTYHRAFDRALIFLDDSYAMRINPEKEAELAKLQLTAGLPDFKNCLGKVHLPQDKNQWPNLELIKRANRFRQISS